MTGSQLALPRDLCKTDADTQAFERNRRPASLVQLAETVENFFTLRNADWGSLFRYASEHPDVVSLLSEAPGAIRLVFGDVRPALELVVDPEENWEELFVVIPTSGSTDQALHQLRQLDANWFGDAARRAKFSANVTVE